MKRGISKVPLGEYNGNNDSNGAKTWTHLQFRILEKF